MCVGGGGGGGGRVYVLILFVSLFSGSSSFCWFVVCDCGSPSLVIFTVFALKIV